MSTQALAPPAAIEGPLPVAPAYNLLRYADLLGGRWEGGVDVRGLPPGVPQGFDPCSTGTDRTKEEGDAPPRGLFQPFTAYVAESCSGLGLGPWDEFKARANSVILATDAYAAEQQLASGAYVAGPYLGDGELDALASGAAVGPLEGLALLEDAIAATARMGVIHATPSTVTLWGDRVVRDGDGLLRTVAAWTPVVSGYGYVGADPDDEASPSEVQAWAFATGPVFAGVGELVEIPEDVADAVERTLNDVIYRAERYLLIGWDTALQAGVLIDRSETP